MAAVATKAAKKATKANTGTTEKELPYREGSCYMNLIETLTKMGVGKLHSWDKIIATVVLPTGFKSKLKRNDETGKGWRDRVIQNCKVLARTDYGASCRKVLRMEVRTEKEGAGLFKL